MRQEHRAGEKLIVDYAGHTVPMTNRESGELREAQIFGRSSLRRSRALSFATAALSEKPSRATVKGFDCCALSRAAPGVCRRSVLRPTMGPTPIR
jgi:hypothetical protein